MHSTLLARDGEVKRVWVLLAMRKDLVERSLLRYQVLNLRCVSDSVALPLESALPRGTSFLAVPLESLFGWTDF